MSSAQRSKDNENVRVQWRMRTHAQPEEPRASTNASVELENMPVLWPANASGGHTAGAARTSVYFGILVYTPRPAPLLHYTVVAVPGQHLVMLQRTQPPAETKASLHEQSFLFLFFWVGGPSFCALMIIGLISFFHRSHCSLLDLNLFGMHRMLALFVFPFLIPLALSFFLLSFTLYFMLLQWA